MARYVSHLRDVTLLAMVLPFSPQSELDLVPQAVRDLKHHVNPTDPPNSRPVECQPTPSKSSAKKIFQEHVTLFLRSRIPPQRLSATQP